MTAETIVHALGGYRAGSGWMARCPDHSDREPGLSISAGDQGTVLIHCDTGIDDEALAATGDDTMPPAPITGIPGGRE